MCEMIAIFNGKTRELGISLRRKFQMGVAAEYVFDHPDRHLTRHGFAYSYGRYELDYGAYVAGQVPQLPGIDTSANYSWLLIDRFARCYDITSFWCDDEKTRKFELMSLSLHEEASWVVSSDSSGVVREMVVGALRAGATKEQLNELIVRSVSGIYGKVDWMNIDNVIQAVKNHVGAEEDEVHPH